MFRPCVPKQKGQASGQATIMSKPYLFSIFASNESLCLVITSLVNYGYFRDDHLDVSNENSVKVTSHLKGTVT